MQNVSKKSVAYVDGIHYNYLSNYMPLQLSFSCSVDAKTKPMMLHGSCGINWELINLSSVKHPDPKDPEIIMPDQDQNFFSSNLVPDPNLPGCII